jgi:RNAse H-fold protein YqgF
MRVLGLDLGSKTLGVAISDPLRMIASPLKTIFFTEDDYEEALTLVSEIIVKEKISEVVLGLPRHMNGDIGIRGEISISFKKLLEETLSITVILWDERLSTKAATRSLITANVSRKKRKKVVDQVAAVVILQSYLDSLR